MPAPHPKRRAVLLGQTDFRGWEKPILLLGEDRRYHALILGKTGMGKSSLLQNLIFQDLKEGEGLALIDPHGDLAEEILGLVPAERVSDVIYFHPEDRECPVGINPLIGSQNLPPGLLASGLVAAFKKVWADSWGPRLEYLLRNALLTCLERPGANLLDVMRLFSNETFREEMALGLRNTELQRFWLQEFQGYSPWLKGEAAAPIQNKVGAFAANPLLRNIVGQRKMTFTFEEVMDGGKIFIANLAKGRIGEDAAHLLGALLLARFFLAALGRAGQSEAERRDFYLYVEEVASFGTHVLSDILSEARKYRLNLIFTGQFLSQLDEAVRDAALGNVGTLVVFRLGAQDARTLAQELDGGLEEVDLVGLPAFHAYLRVPVKGSVTPTFSMKTLPPPKGSESIRKQVIEASRARYGRPREEVEREVLVEATSEEPFSQEI